MVDFAGLFRLSVCSDATAMCFFVTAVILCRAEPSEVESSSWRGRQIKSDAAGNVVYVALKISLALKKLSEYGVVKHEDLFIASKLWFCDHAPEDVPEAIVATLEELLQQLLCLSCSTTSSCTIFSSIVEYFDSHESISKTCTPQ